MARTGTELLPPPPPKNEGDGELLPPPPKKKDLSGGEVGGSIGGAVGSFKAQSKEYIDPLANQKRVFTGLNKAPTDVFTHLESTTDKNLAPVPKTGGVVGIDEIMAQQKSALSKKPMLDDNGVIQKPPTQMEINDKLKREEVHKRNVDIAIDNTTKEYFRLKGMNVPTSSPLFIEHKQKVQQAFDNGDVAYHMDLRTNTPRLDRITGWWENLSKGWNEANIANDEAAAFANDMTTEERVKYVKLKQLESENRTPDEYLDERQGAAGWAGHTLGGAAPFLGKAAAGFTLGTMALAAAPETGGLSLEGLPIAASFLATASDASNHGGMNETIRRYNYIRKQNPEMSDVDAMREAESGLLAGGIGGIAENALFMNTMKLPISAEGKEVLGKFATETLQSGLNMGGATAAIDVAQKLEGAAEGYKTTPKEVAESAVNTFVDNAKVGMALHGIIQGVPKAFNSALKFVLKDVPKQDIDATLQTNVEAGTITPEQAQKVSSDIDGYNEALSKTADGLKPETQASVAGLIQARDNVIREMNTKDPTQRASYEEKIENYNKQIEKITKTNDPLKYEVDDITGKPLGEPPELNTTEFSKVADEVKIPVYKEVFKNGSEQDVKDALKDVSDQWHDEGTQKATENNFPKEIIDAAKKEFPQETQKSLSIEKPTEQSGKDVVVDEGVVDKGVEVGEEMAKEKLPTLEETYDILESEEGSQGGSWLNNEFGDARFNSEAEARAYAKEVHDYLVSLGEEKEIPVYRAVSAEDVDLSPYGIGESWSFSLDAAKEFAKHLGVPLSKVKIISGKVPSENVDWNKAIRNYHNFSDIMSGESEFELPIPSNRKIYDVKVQDYKTAKEQSLSTKPEIKNEEAKAIEVPKPTEKESVAETKPNKVASEAEIKKAIEAAAAEKKSVKAKNDAMEAEAAKHGKVGEKVLAEINKEEGGNKVGVSHESLTDLAKKLKLKEPEVGEYHSPEWYAERGRELLKAGADPKEVNNPNNELHDRISIARAYLEKLVKEADKIARDKGIESDEYKAAHEMINNYANNVVKKLGTKAGQAMTALQGERDIDTDSFTAVKRYAEDTIGKPLSKEQEAKIKELVAKNEELKRRADEAERLLIEATDKAFKEAEIPKSKQSIKEKSKKTADIIRKLKTTRPDTFSSGNVVWDGAVEVVAKTIELGGSIADAIANGIEHIKESEWYIKLSDDKKRVAEKDFSETINKELNNTPEAKNIKRLEKELEDLQKGIAKQKSPPRKLTEREKELKEEIKDKRAMMGLEPSKINKPASETEKVEKNVKDAKEQEKIDAEELDKLQKKFVDKGEKDTKFSIEEAKAIWDYAKRQYLDRGVSFRDMIAHISEDLGLTWKQASIALTSKKTQRISDEMWKASSDRIKNQHATKNWIEAQNKSLPMKWLRAVSAAFRGVSVFGHGGIFIGTHAGMTLFNPSQWEVVIPAFIRGWKFAYGNKAKYLRRIEQLKNDPNYIIAQRAGLKNNPDQVNTEEFQKSQKFFEKIGGEAGVKGFNAIKVLRQDLFNMHYKQLSEVEKNDPEAVEQIAKLINNATGATNLKMPEWVNEVSFAGGMEATRWGKLTRNPARATAIAIKALVKPESVTTAEKVFAKVWARRVGEQLGVMAGMMLANAAIQKAVNPNNPTNLTDPDKPDFMKFKFGDLTIDPSSGMRGTAMFIYGLGKIPFMDNKQRRGDTPLQYAGKSVAGYTRGKFAPLYSTMADFFDQKDFNKNPMPFSNEKPGAGHHKLTWGEYLWEKAPLPVAHAAGEMYKAALDHNGGTLTSQHVIDGIIAGILSGGTGFRVGEYNAEEADHSPFTKEDKADPTFKYYLDKGLELPSTSLSSEIVTDKKSMTKKKVSDYSKEIQDKYVQVHKDYLKKELADVKRKGYVYTVEYLTGDGDRKVEVYMYKKPNSKRKNLDDLTKDEMAQVLSTAQSQATKLTKKKVFNQK